jgi:hypothetical protein
LGKYQTEYQDLAKESLGEDEQKKHKPWFDEQCSKFTDQRKQVKLQWLQDPSQINTVNLNQAGTKRGNI